MKAAIHLPLNVRIKAKIEALLRREIKSPNEEALVRWYLIGIVFYFLLFLVSLFYLLFVVVSNKTIHGNEIIPVITLEHSRKKLTRFWKNKVARR